MGKQVSPALATTAHAWRQETTTNPLGATPGDDPLGGTPGDASTGRTPEATEIRDVSTENPSASCKPPMVFEDGLQQDTAVVGVAPIPGESCVIVSAWRHKSKGRARGGGQDASASAWMRKPA
jgi:hypothetical protein